MNIKKTRNKFLINRVIRFLILSDLFILSGWGMTSPIFAIYVTEQVKMAGIETVGLASTVYLLLKSGLQVPLASFMDKVRGERDDFLAMVIGSVIICLVPLLYILVRTVPQLFVIQAIYGIGGALSYPSWLALFTRHVDKQKEAWEWSLYYTAIDLSGAGVAALGGFLAKYWGFKPLFLLVFGLSFLGTVVLFKIQSDLKRPRVSPPQAHLKMAG
jgi:MFS family permease